MFFCGVSNTDIKLTTCKDNIVIISKLQGYVLYWCHTYLLHAGMNIIESIIRPHLYWPNIRYAVCKEVTNCDSCQRTKRSNKNMENYHII